MPTNPSDAPVELIKNFVSSEALDSDALDAASMYMNAPAFEAFEKETYRFRMNELTEKMDGLTVKVGKVQATVDPMPDYPPAFGSVPSMEVEWTAIDLAQPVEIAKISLDRRKYYWCCQSDMEERDPLNLMRLFPKLSLRGIRLSISRQCYSLWLAADVFEKLGDWIEL